MTKKLTIMIDGAVYDGLYRVVGPRKISQFIERLVRPHVMDLDAAYNTMSQDEKREIAAEVWSENLIGDVGEVNNETW